MNIHKNARLTLLRPIQMVKDLTERGLSATAAADAYGVTAPTARKWLILNYDKSYPFESGH